ncbi:MAG: XrtB/PEP-CTERM-associated polysaccharide biosynthesis outer membrane protein EpsL [Methylophilaceae bacterium]
MIFKQQHLITSLTIKKILPFTAIFLIFILFNEHALAIANRPIHFVAGVIRKHDDNLFKQANNTKSDNVTGLSAGLKLDKQLSLQRFTAEATLTNNRYNKNDHLNYTSKNFEAAWHWALTPRLTGKLAADRSESLNNFNDTRSNEKNVRVEQNQLFLADFNPSGGLHYLAGLSRRSLDNSRTFNEDTSFSSNSVDLGVKYVFPSDSSITLMNHVRKGKYDDRRFSQATLFDDKYKEYESEIGLDWVLTVKSRIDVGVSYLKRDHKHFSARDYSGFQAKAGYDWSPTEKIKIKVNARSRLSTYQTDVDSYTRTNELLLRPKYLVTPKVSVNGELSMAKRKFLGGGYNALTTKNRVDDYKSVGLGVEWKPTLNSSVKLSWLHYDSDSNNNLFDYKGNTTMLSGQIEF